MKRWLVNVTIVAYLSFLAFGVASHGLKTKTYSNPTMYFIVWDMFCGWNAYSQRYHLMGEGESGKFYELGSSPWGEYHPYGNLDRRHYDASGSNGVRFALNTLKHTNHEPIERIYVIEESWAKKYNIHDDYWKELYDGPKQKHSYFYTRQVLNGDGVMIKNSPPWVNYQAQLTVMDNPRLHADSKRTLPFYAVDAKPLPKNNYQIPGSPLFNRSNSLNGN